MIFVVLSVNGCFGQWLCLSWIEITLKRIMRTLLVERYLQYSWFTLVFRFSLLGVFAIFQNFVVFFSFYAGIIFCIYILVV